ncbi:hypothetical protein, partial [Pseudomonas syringae]|uniref:hypothetical protein n=1 Tax=Pseudomonas syringae TaxID=317 RepID=UPI001F1C4BB1
HMLILKPSNRKPLANRVTTSGRSALGVGIVICLSSWYSSGATGARQLPDGGHCRQRAINFM